MHVLHRLHIQRVQDLFAITVISVVSIVCAIDVVDDVSAFSVSIACSMAMEGLCLVDVACLCIRIHWPNRFRSDPQRIGAPDVLTRYAIMRSVCQPQMNLGVS